MLKNGDNLPSLSLLDDRGKVVELKSLANDYFLVIFFYPRDYVPTSTKESCIFRDNYQEFKSLGAQIVGISSDSVDAHRTFKENYSLPFILLSDEENLARLAFGVPKSFGILPGRATFVADKRGIIRMNYFDQFHVLEHIAQSLVAIKELNKEMQEKR